MLLTTLLLHLNLKRVGNIVKNCEEKNIKRALK